VLVLAAAAACEDPAGARLSSVSPDRLAANGQLVIELDAAVDPASVDRRAVRVSDGAGRVVEAEVGVAGGRVVVQPVVRPEALAAAPERLVVTLAGLPSPHALRTVSGAALERTQTVESPLTAALLDDSGVAPRLVAVQGRPPRSPAMAGPGGELVLEFDGVLDPARLSPADCALRPRAGQLVLDPTVLPQVDWRCVGRRFELRLRLPPDAGPLLLSLRRSGLRGLDGRPVEPALELLLDPR
jgi:hypothetical protein